MLKTAPNVYYLMLISTKKIKNMQNAIKYSIREYIYASKTVSLLIHGKKSAGAFISKAPAVLAIGCWISR